MGETLDRRASPKALWPEVRSLILLGMNYGPDSNPLALLEDKTAANISVYARNRDYHDLIKGRLKLLAQWLASQGRASQGLASQGRRTQAASDIGLKVFVDTAPVMEKPLAQAAGLGWQGKHTNLVSRDYGSWLFLGSIFTTLPLEPDAPEEDHCGTCRACLDICPTQAFVAPYQLDARLCISYLTIEHKGMIPRALREKMGNRVYGCDDCLAACPWNKFAQEASETKLRAREDLANPPIEDWLQLDDQTFRTLFSGSPVKRIGVSRFLRNLLIAAGNSRTSNHHAPDRDAPSLMQAVEQRLGHDSALVRGTAIWALGRLGGTEAVARSAHRWQTDERDDSVLAEWDAALKGADPGSADKA